METTYRKAQFNDLSKIITLLHDDDLGRTRENAFNNLDAYESAFRRIDNDPNQYLIVVMNTNKIIGTCHCTLIPSLTFKGSLRMQIEGVRVSQAFQNQGVGRGIINHAEQWGISHGAKITQLTTNKTRAQSMKFYEKLGFEPTHVGFKRYIKEITCP